jgi:predicted TIM-barrel fold metal-dependent hydrolase
MDDFPIIDPHHHLWDLTLNSYPWLTPPFPVRFGGDYAPIAQNYLVDDYIRDAAPQKVVKSVHVEAAFDPAHPVEETRWLQSVANKNGFPHGIVAHAELHNPDVEKILAAHCAFPNMRGIRHALNWHPDPTKTFVERPDYMSDASWLRGFRLLKHYGLSFDLMLYPSQLSDATRLAHAHEDTLIVLNHTGMPVDRDPEALALWRSGMKELATAPNVRVKISGLGMVDWHWTEQSIKPFVMDTIEFFGVDRCMFASNFPVDRLYSSYADLYQAFRNLVRDFSIGERRRLFAETAETVYRL